jgi:hypothetical protein
VLLLWDAAGLIGVSTRERPGKLDWKNAHIVIPHARFPEKDID